MAIERRKSPPPAEGPVTMSSLELRIPPVVILLVMAVAMWLVARALPSWGVSVPARAWLAVALAVAGVAIALAGIREFRRARTTLHPQTPEQSSSVVRSGIYRYSRNPMYVGMLCVLVAWAAWLGNVASLLLAAAVVPYMNRFQIQPEERALLQKFGAEYAGYLRQTRRWL
jgi:protein-S-isoprenylcysteine O-methyltransferase Ste14